MMVFTRSKKNCRWQTIVQTAAFLGHESIAFQAIPVLRQMLRGAGHGRFDLRDPRRWIHNGETMGCMGRVWKQWSTLKGRKKTWNIYIYVYIYICIYVYIYIYHWDLHRRPWTWWNIHIKLATCLFKHFQSTMQFRPVRSNIWSNIWSNDIFHSFLWEQNTVSWHMIELHEGFLLGKASTNGLF